MKLCRECLEFSTGVRAVWLLYRWGRWDLLKRLGIPRTAEGVFQEFEDTNILGVGGKLKSEAQVRALTKAYPSVVGAATQLVGLYMIQFSAEIPAIDKEFERLEQQNLSRDNDPAQRPPTERRPDSGKPAPREAPGD